ncbi:hypothetical protein CFE70_003695 [Pyrenophora teres f. teres 0-1]
MSPSTYTPYANSPDNILYPSSSPRLPVPHGLFFLCTGLLALGLWYTLDNFTPWTKPLNEDTVGMDDTDGEEKTKIVVVFDDEVEFGEFVKEFFWGLDGAEGIEEQEKEVE